MEPISSPATNTSTPARWFIAVDLQRQLQSGTFEHALNYLIDHQLDLSRFGARYQKDLTGATAYRSAMPFKVVLFAYQNASNCHHNGHPAVKNSLMKELFLQSR